MKSALPLPLCTPSVNLTMSHPLKDAARLTEHYVGDLSSPSCSQSLPPGLSLAKHPHPHLPAPPHWLCLPRSPRALRLQGCPLQGAGVCKTGLSSSGCHPAGYRLGLINNSQVSRLLNKGLWETAVTVTALHCSLERGPWGEPGLLLGPPIPPPRL